MKEQSDNRECEFKFTYAGDQEALLAEFRSFTTSSRPLVSMPPRAITDLYFDTPGRDLLGTGSTLRLRKRRINPGWTMNFKSPPLPWESDFTDRREVITRLTIDECLQYRCQSVPGLAWRCAIRYLARNSFAGELHPSLYLVTWRTGWSVKTGDLSDRQSNYILLFRDDVVALDIDSHQPDLIIRYGMIDYSQRSPRRFAFTSYEIEASGRETGDRIDAVAALRQAAHILGKLPSVRAASLNKYQVAFSGLNSD